MPRGPKKHLKRLNAPSHWMLDKLGGVFAPKPSPGPHKQRECLPLTVLLRNRLKWVPAHGWHDLCAAAFAACHMRLVSRATASSLEVKTKHALQQLTVVLSAAPRYALTGREVTAILMQRHVKVDGKVRHC